MAHDIDALIVNRCPVPPKLIDRLSRCRVIVRYGVGVDTVAVEKANERGILVCNVPDYCVEEVAIHTWALILSLWRRIFEGHRLLKKGQWLSATSQPGLERLSRAVLGVFGFGKIGRQVCRIGKAFGLKCLAFDPYVPPDHMEAEGVIAVGFERLLTESDIVTLHSPLTKETEEAFNRQAFNKMRRGAIFINTARGGLVDEEDLLWALEEGIIAGAGLDVFLGEPQPDRRLIAHPRVIATPHWAWYSLSSARDLRHKVAMQVLQALKGLKPDHCINWDVARR